MSNTISVMCVKVFTSYETSLTEIVTDKNKPLNIIAFLSERTVDDLKNFLINK